MPTSGKLKRAGVGFFSSIYSTRYVVIVDSESAELHFFADEACTTKKDEPVRCAGAKVSGSGVHIVLEDEASFGSVKLKASDAEAAASWRDRLRALCATPVLVAQVEVEEDERKEHGGKATRCEQEGVTVQLGHQLVGGVELGGQELDSLTDEDDEGGAVQPPRCVFVSHAIWSPPTPFISHAGSNFGGASNVGGSAPEQPVEMSSDRLGQGRESEALEAKVVALAAKNASLEHELATLKSQLTLLLASPVAAQADAAASTHAPLAAAAHALPAAAAYVPLAAAAYAPPAAAAVSAPTAAAFATIPTAVARFAGLLKSRVAHAKAHALNAKFAASPETITFQYGDVEQFFAGCGLPRDGPLRLPVRLWPSSRAPMAFPCACGLTLRHTSVLAGWRATLARRPRTFGWRWSASTIAASRLTRTTSRTPRRASNSATWRIGPSAMRRRARRTRWWAAKGGGSPTLCGTSAAAPRACCSRRSPAFASSARAGVQPATRAPACAL